MKRTEWRTVLLAIMALCALGCADMDSADSQSPGAGSGGDWGDADGDVDGDVDGDGSGDSGSPADPGAPGHEIIPEQEERFDYRIPQSSGKYVFIADQANDRVVAVDSGTLAIHLLPVGDMPTHLVPISDAGAVAVLALNSDEVTLIRMDNSGHADMQHLDVRPDTNALAVSNTGRYVIAFWDSLFAEETGAPQTDQEISVIDTTPGAEAVFHMSVGLHPMEIQFNLDDTRAFVITESGINVIDLTNLENVFLPDSVVLFDYTTITPDMTDVAIDPTGTIAIGRRENSPLVTVVWLDHSGMVREYELNTIPTDLDIAPDGSFGLLTSRYGREVAFFDLPFPVDPGEDPFVYMSMGTTVAGAATITPDGQNIALYTTVGEENRDILTIFAKSASGWDVNAARLGRNIRSVRAAPDSGTFVVHHEVLAPQQVTPQIRAHSYSLVKIPGMQTKFQQLPDAPVQFLMTSDGQWAYLIQPEKTMDIINLRTFIVDTMILGSVPVAVGHASQTDRIFVAQDHPSGRMTFLDVDGSNVRTVTGYTLNERN